MSANRRVEKNGVSNQSAQESSLRLKNKGKSPMVGVSKPSGSYPYRPGQPDCSYYLRTGSCGYGSNCRFNHPVYDAQGGQYREKLPERTRQPNCVEKKSCTYYTWTGSCRFGDACKFHHHQSASPLAGLPANGPVGSSIMPRSGVHRAPNTWSRVPRVPNTSGPRIQTQSYMPVAVSPQNTISAHGRGTYMDQIVGDKSEFRGWDELIPEALGLIFSDLSLEELLTVIPRVCKSWRNVVTGPYCWQEIDIEQWSKHRRPRHVDRMLRMLITRSSGSLRKLSVSGLQSDSVFSFITKNASSLQALRLPGSEVRGSVVAQTAKRLSTITLLDLSYCSNIGSKALEAIGKHCKLLVTLFRNVEPDMLVDELADAEANAIAATMPRLKHLEMADHEISTEGVMNILSGCPQLEFLNIRGCCDVELDSEFLKEKFPKLKVVGPFSMEDFDDREWDGVYYNTDSDFDPWDPEYLDYDDYTDPFHPDHHQNDDEYEFWSEFFDEIGDDARMYRRMFG